MHVCHKCERLYLRAAKPNHSRMATVALTIHLVTEHKVNDFEDPRDLVRSELANRRLTP